MAQVYASIIKKGVKKIEQVPAKIREQVQAILDQK